jgi:DNA transposition AAA+ family ATPase
MTGSHVSNVIGTNDLAPLPAVFVVTNEYQRFAEFCDACRRYRYIGLCYGAPGVGKTWSARHYADWDRIAAHLPVRDAETAALQALRESQTVFYTPAVVHSPGQIERDITRRRHDLRSILLEEQERRQRLHLAPLWQQEFAAEEERQRQLLTRVDWLGEAASPPAVSEAAALARSYARANAQIADPTTLVIIDEADRLKMGALEQVRDIFDQGEVGVILIGMPGIEKRLARYPQLYSRVGFVHAFRPLTAMQVRELLRQQEWRPPGVALTAEAIADEEALAAVIRITGGNFRLLQRLLTQIARLLEINELSTITTPVVQAARESLVIGTT